MSDVIKNMATTASIDGKKITDRGGRIIVLRKPDIMDRFYLFRAMGADASNNQLAGMMMPTIYVAAIDDAPFPTPKTQFECEHGLKRLGEDGWSAVSEEIEKYLNERDKEAENTIKK